MTNVTRDAVRQGVLKYFSHSVDPVRLRVLADGVRHGDAQLKSIRDADVRSVVQPMIVTGKLSYAPGLRIRLGEHSS